MSKNASKKVTSKSKADKEVKEVTVVEEQEPIVDINRQSIIDTLKQIGVEPDLKKSTEKLTEDLRNHVLRMNKQLGDKEADYIEVRIRGIRSQTNLSDNEFLTRLIQLGVPDLYLKKNEKNGAPFFVFTDADKTLSDKQIWERIRFSGISPLKTNELFTKNIKRPERYHFGSKSR